MSKGIVNSTPVRETVGLRIQSARKDKKLSRSALAELIVHNELCPAVTTRKNTSEIKTPAEALADRLKQWEYGNNPVDLEYIPAICNVLECDVGYLFAEYPEKKHNLSDLRLLTGLSEKAVEELQNLSHGESYKFVFMDYLLCSDDLPKLLKLADDHAFTQTALFTLKEKGWNTSEIENGIQEQAELAEYQAFKTTLDIIRKYSQYLVTRCQKNG